MTRLVAVAAASVLLTSVVIAPAVGAASSGYTSAARPAAAVAPAAKTFKNCTALNKKYPHGVGRSKTVRDSTSGTPVTNFKVSRALYKANKKSDRDKDGIACEKR